MFQGISGIRYQVELRVDEGSEEMAPCTGNGNDIITGVSSGEQGSCDAVISSGQLSCAADLCPSCRAPHYCDLSCGFLCTENGVTDAILHVLPPGATERGQAVASQGFTAADKGLGFTAAATGTFTIELYASKGSGSVTVTVTAVGSAEERSPPLRVDALPHPLRVSCYHNNCAFEYDGSTLHDADGIGADLVLAHAEAGRSYALQVQLVGNTAVQITTTFYKAGAVAGAAGFEPVVMGPMGEWTATPVGHESIAQHRGCDNEDKQCLFNNDHGISELASFGIHPVSSKRFLRTL